MRNNQVIGTASAGSAGLKCDDSTSRALGKIINGFVTPIAVCRGDGNSLRAILKALRHTSVSKA